MFDQLPLLRSPAQLRSRIRSWRAFGEKVALVPVLGPAHRGHGALIRAAQEEEMRAVACLIDPCHREAGPAVEEDAERLEAMQADSVYVPAMGCYAPEGFRTRVRVAGLTDILCGAVDPGCLDLPVLTLLRLMTQTGADLMLFSEVHWQMGVIMGQLAGDFDLATEVRILPALRDADGVPVSAETARLSPGERQSAARLAAALRRAAREAKAGAAPEAACRFAREQLAHAGFSAVDYIELRHAGTLAPVPDAALGGPARVFGAARLGGLRLVDSLAVA